MTRMDQSDIVVSFTLSDDEARRQTADLQKKTGVTKALVRLQLGVGVPSLALGIFEVATNHMRWTGWFYALYGLCYVFIALQTKSRLIDVPAGVETSIRFGPAEIVMERPAPQTLPWSAVEGMDRYEDALIARFFVSEIKPPLEQRIVIPKRAFADGGLAFWHLSERMLLGPLRRVSAQMSVDETGALRRMDAMHIDNVRVRNAKRKPRSLSTQAASLRS